MPDTSALSSVPASGDRRSISMTAELRFFYGPMDCGKSTLALQIDHNHTRQGRHGLLLTRNDRSAQARISSRMGMGREAVEVTDELDLRRVVRDRWSTGARVDYLIVDEAQFLTVAHVEQLAELADGADVDVYAFGLASDFRSELFAGSKRLIELADRLIELQVEVLCWCGRRGAFNGRVVDGRLVKEGVQVLVADTSGVDSDREPGADSNDKGRRVHLNVRYQVLCRRHWRAGDIGPQADDQDRLPLDS